MIYLLGKDPPDEHPFVIDLDMDPPDEHPFVIDPFGKDPLDEPSPFVIGQIESIISPPFYYFNKGLISCFAPFKNA